MTNVPFETIGSFRDLESLGYYATAVGTLGQDPAQIVATLRRKSRDNARTPMQWDGTPGGGFSTAVPWIAINPNHTWLNAASQTGDPHSIYSYYRTLIALRHSRPVIVDGGFAVIETGREQVYAFRRSLGDEHLEVYANLSDHPVSMDEIEPADGQVVLGNYEDSERAPDRLAPWEARVYRR